MSTDTYTHGHHESVSRAHAVRSAATSAGYLLPHLRPGMRLLDVGCGPGSITLDLADRLGAGQVIGIERDEAPLRVARAAAADRGDTRTRFELGDAYRLPFADAEFDVVHAHQVLQHLTDPITALREMRRVCRPGGLIAVRDADYSSMTWYPQSEGMTQWLDTYRSLARGNRAEPDAGRRLKAWALRAGLDQLATSASLWSYTSAQECAWWGNVWVQRALHSSYADQARERGLLDQDGLQAVADAWEAWSRQPEAWFAMLHGEVIATA